MACDIPKFRFESSGITREKCTSRMKRRMHIYEARQPMKAMKFKTPKMNERFLWETVKYWDAPSCHLSHFLSLDWLTQEFLKGSVVFQKSFFLERE